MCLWTGAGPCRATFDLENRAVRKNHIPIDWNRKIRRARTRSPAPKCHLLPPKLAKTFPPRPWKPPSPSPSLTNKKNEARRCFETELVSFPLRFFFQGKLFSKMTHFCQTFHSQQIGVVTRESARLGISEALREASVCFYRVKNQRR